MTDPKKFFDDNISRLPRPISTGTQEQQREYNLNAGLRAMSEQLAALQREQAQTQHQLTQILHVLSRMK